MLVVNLFGGPGAGKSTTAAGLFHILKLKGINTELVTEFAKDLTWEERFGALSCQPYVFGKQLHRLERLRGKVDIVITDSPILLSSIYSKKNGWPKSLTNAIIECSKRFSNFNILLTRDKPYSTVGRTQTEEESRSIDSEVESSFRLYWEDWYMKVPGNKDAPTLIMDGLINAGYLSAIKGEQDDV